MSQRGRLRSRNQSHLVPVSFKKVEASEGSSLYFFNLFPFEAIIPALCELFPIFQYLSISQ